jgi:hypothetical protein
MDVRLFDVRLFARVLLGVPVLDRRETVRRGTGMAEEREKAE